MPAVTTEHMERSADRHEEEEEEDRLRPWKRAERADNLWSAAHLYSYAGEKRRALRIFEDAAGAARPCPRPRRHGE